jgi:hypothetical protein
MFDPRKHYTGTRMQAGRLITDFDWNDDDEIDGEESRRTRLDVIGAYGSPDSGFRVENVRVENNVVEFDILPGTLYLGGLRLMLEAMQTYRSQSDVLQLQDIAGKQPNTKRSDLVFIEAYEASVSGIEDGELLDPALGGVDTAQRLRRFQRVLVLPDVSATNCDQAWAALQELIAHELGGQVGDEYRLVVDTKLTVTYTEAGIDDDLCEPPLTGGYLGAENQAIRVQLVDKTHFAWGLDMAAPLYRVSLSADRIKLTMITQPRDDYSTPQVGQVIELLPWSVALSNGEKTAAHSGHLTRISAVDLNDETAGGGITITLETAVPTAGFDDWQNRPDAGELADPEVYYFMHIWNRGADIGSDPAITFAFGTPVTLGTTGIQVTFTGTDASPGDYWVIAARPETPTRVLPWGLEDGQPPEGVERYYAPLALINWRQNNTIKVTDCRPPFRPLTRLQYCCTFMVGDGVNSDGDFNDLNEALDRLPDNGGEICLLPGIHKANVVITGRTNVTISGCGVRSKLIPTKADGGAVISVQDSSGIGLFNFDVVTVDGTGILAEDVSGLRIEEMRVLAYKVGIDVDRCDGVRIRRCIVRMLDKEGGDVGIFALGERVVIEGCDVQVIPAGTLPEPPDDDKDPDTPPVDPTDPCAEPEKFYLNLLYLAYYTNIIWGLKLLFDLFKLDNPYESLGGIQIGSGSEDVLIRENLIVGGAGNGVTLGSDIGDLVLDQTPVEPPDDEEEEDLRFKHDQETIRGTVLFEDKPIGGMTIFFDNGSGQIIDFPVLSDGTFGGKLPPGEYRVYVSDQKLRVSEIENLDADIYIVRLKERVLDEGERPSSVRDLLAFIYDAIIEGNTIGSMGLSGIGAPRFETADAVALRGFATVSSSKLDQSSLLMVYLLTGTITGFSVDLTIYRNHIVRCLQNVVLPAVQTIGEFSIERGIGGVSLALCDGVTIAENVIEECGRGAEIPVCGIFVSFAVDATLKDNHVLNNGQDTRLRDQKLRAVQEQTNFFGRSVSPDTATESLGKTETSYNAAAYVRFRTNQAAGFSVAPNLEFRLGPRGGIVIPFCLSANAFAGAARTKTSLRGSVASADVSATRGLTTLATGRHAARIDGNYVTQPFGRALFLGAVGSVSVTDNQFISDLALTRELDAQSGGISGAMAAALKVAELDFFASNVMIVNLGLGFYIPELLGAISKQLSLARTAIPAAFPDGNILFTSNQIKQADSGERTTVVSVISMDDVNFSDNQIDVLNGDTITSTATVFAMTARATNNRFKEPLSAVLEDEGTNRYSLVDIGFMAASMIGNQGHYCFVVASSIGTAVALGNQPLLASALKCLDEVQDMPPALNFLGILLLQVSLLLTRGLLRQKS